MTQINVFERKMLMELLQNVQVLDRQDNGSIRTTLTPEQIASNIELSMNTLPKEANEHIAKAYYEYISAKWIMSFSYDSDVIATNPSYFPFSTHVRATIHDVSNTIRIEINPTTFSIILNRQTDHRFNGEVASIHIALHSYELIKALLGVGTYYEFTRTVISMSHAGVCTVTNRFTTMRLDAEMAVFLLLVSVGDEKAIMPSMFEILRISKFVMIPFFAAESQKIHAQYMYRLSFPVAMTTDSLLATASAAGDDERDDERDTESAAREDERDDEHDM